MTTSLEADELAQAYGLHRAGDLTAAARRYQAILAREPEHADATCLLGMVRLQEGQPGLAVELIGKAIAVRPGVAAFHASLGQCWQSLGCRQEAAEEFGRVLEIDPGDASAHVNRGVAVRGLGEPEAALVHFRQAVALAPGLAQARTNLGELLLEMGRSQEALMHCQAAVALRPDLAEAHVNLGNAQRFQGRLAEARQSYLQAIRLQPRLGPAAAGLGLTLSRLGSADEALEWLRRAVALEPASIEFLRGLAEAATAQELYPEVQACCERILELDPVNAVAHNALGWMLQEAGRHEEARQRYQTALRHQPEFATAHYNLGLVHEELGERSEAEASFRAALRIHPAYAMALARLAGLRRDALPETDLAAIRRLSQTAADPADRINLLFGLAQVHDARQEFTEAARCLESSNALVLVERQRHGCAYDPADHHRFVTDTIAAFAPALFPRLDGTGLDTPGPVFLFGLPRSGTTLIEQVLASHPAIHGAGEVPLVRQCLEQVPRLMNRSDPPLSCVADLDGRVVRELAEWHEERLRQLDGGRPARVVCKMPENYVYLGLIPLMFPRAVLIHCRRDLRDVALSCWSTNFTDVRWASDFDHIATRFAEYHRLMTHWRSVLPATIHDVCYEQTVDDIEATARRLVSLCGLAWHPACLDFHRTRRPIRTASVNQVRRPIYRDSVGRWKSYRHELAGLFARVDSGPAEIPRDQPVAA